jgi:hypothetical protein
MESKGSHFVFYWVVGIEVDFCVFSGWFSLYDYFEVCLVACYFQIKEIYGISSLVDGVKFYLVMNLIYVCVDGLGLDFHYVMYDQDIVDIRRV